MEDSSGTNQELIKEIYVLKQRIQKLEQLESERKLVEEALWQSEEKFKTIFDKASDGILIADATTKKFLQGNTTICSMLGYTKEEIESLSIYDIHPPKDISHVLDETVKQLKGDKALAEALPVLRKDGSIFYADIGAAPITIGGIHYLVGIFRDITDRKQAEETLRESEEKYRILFEDSRDALMILFPPGWKFTSCNQATLEMFGAKDMAEFVSLSPADVSPELQPDGRLSADKALEMLETAVREGHHFFEWTHRRLNGEAFPCTVLLSRGEIGGKTFVQALVRDITVQENIKITLQENEHKIRAILDQTFQFIGLMTNEGILIEANRSALDAVGVEANSVLGKPFWETPWWTHSPELQEKLRQAVKNVAQGELVRFEATYLLKDGTLHYMDFSLKPIKDESGNVIFMIPEGRDITERKQMEEKLLLAQVELEGRVAERTDALRDLREANIKLSDRTKDVERRNREIELLGYMGNLMQSCQSVDEAYNVLVQTMKQIFPNDSGVLFIFRSSRNLLEAAAVWGKTRPKEMSFIPDDCWAMRRGRDYCIADVATGLKCKHVEDAVEAYLCVPMITQGEVQGSFYFMRGSGDMTQSAEKWLEENQLIVHSITEQIGLALGNIKLRETLRNLAIHDPLTALYNRRFMEESFDREFLRSKRKNIPIGIVMLDIDHFKLLNDTFGHEAGDAVLREMGSLLQKCVRGSDIACRYGGEEFVLILSEASLVVTLERAENIREQVKHLNVIHAGKPLGTINISAGVAMFPDHGETVEAVLHAADIALYQAKKSGRDKVCVAEFDGNAASSQETRIDAS